MSSPAPSPGQLVTVRERRFVVTAVRPGALGPDPMGGGTGGGPQHLVALSSVEDDGLGEELQVVWELEPGARTFERAALPDPTEGFDDPARLDAFLDAVRWGAVASADKEHLHAPFRSGIAIEDYQLDPVVRALQMPRVNLLIADDVGLGKTIEAGLVVQELLLRHRARTVLVACPAGLQIQWRDQMRDKFGLEFRIVDSELMKELRRRRGLHVNPWNQFPRLITSIDFLKRDRPMRLFREVFEGRPAFPRLFDLLIVDEAHNVAPSGRGNYALDSQRTQAIRTLAPHFEHKLFLTATPHNGYTESFSALLELLDDQRFHRGVPPDRAQVAAVMVRRLKRALPPDDLGRPRFPERVLRPIEIPYTAEEREAHRRLSEYARLRQEGAAAETERFATEFVLKLLKKRLFSSPEAFRITLEKHVRHAREGRSAPVMVRTVPLGLLRREVERAEEEDADDDRHEEEALEAVAATTQVFRPLSVEEEALLEDLLGWARRASGGPDSKARKLLAWLHATVRPEGRWGDTRVILFTEYRATQNWLHGLLAAERLADGERLRTLYGGMPTEEREAVKAAFQAGPEKSAVRILLATDAASEGIDLQNHCSRLVHYEIPWNPNRMEQRNGRVDRHGQRERQVRVFHFVGEGFDEAKPGAAPGSLSGDLEFLMRAALKVEQIREDLGSVGDVIASQVEEAMLGRRRTLEPERVSRRTEEARAMLRFERQLQEDLARMHERLRESREELRLSPENLKAVVDVGLELGGQAPLARVAVPDKDRQGQADAWRVPELGGTWAACADGLAHPHDGTVRPIVFDHGLADGRDDVVLAHGNHRLLQMCLSLLRAQIWAPEGQRKLRRVSARVVPDRLLELPVVFAHARLVVLGGDSVRLHEEVIVTGGSLKEGRFARLPVTEVRSVMEAAGSAQAQARPAPPKVCDRLAALWPGHADAVLAALEARMKERTKNLDAAMQRRRDSEMGDVRQILEELRRAIVARLDAPLPEQRSLFTAPEEEQFERNRDSLRARAESIPAEIEREVERIRRRYESPSPRLFPVAITYLVPERLGKA